MIVLRDTHTKEGVVEWFFSEDSIEINSKNPKIESKTVPMSTILSIDIETKKSFFSVQNIHIRYEAENASLNDHIILFFSNDDLDTAQKAYNYIYKYIRTPKNPDDIILYGSLKIWTISGGTITMMELKQNGKDYEKKVVPISEIYSVNVKFEKSFLGELNSLDLSVGSPDPTKSEKYSYYFDGNFDKATVLKAKEYIEECIANLSGSEAKENTFALKQSDNEAKENAENKSRSMDEIAYEISVLKNLLYSGMITEEEFELKKRKLLGI